MIMKRGPSMRMSTGTVIGEQARIRTKVHGRCRVSCIPAEHFLSSFALRLVFPGIVYVDLFSSFLDFVSYITSYLVLLIHLIHPSSELHCYVRSFQTFLTPLFLLIYKLLCHRCLDPLLLKLL